MKWKGLFLFCCVFILTGCHKPLEIKGDITLEFGESISLDAKDYLISDNKEIIDNTKVQIINDKKVENQNYQEVGKYEVLLKYKNEEETIIVTVQDTTKPEFVDFKETISIYQGETIDFDKIYTLKDLSKTTLKVDDSQLNNKKVGSYEVRLLAQDQYQNINEKVVKVMVKEMDVNSFVRVKDYIPSIYVDLKYATKDNFTHKVIYDFNEAYLRYGTVKKLKRVQDSLLDQGYSLKIWDAYRPFSAQKTLWNVVSNPVYVGDPRKGPRGHNIGGTVDITLVKKDGRDIPMPTDFDNFSKKADRNYSDISRKEAVKNVKKLEKAMKENSFKPYFNEWWHYTDSISYNYINFEVE